MLLPGAASVSAKSVGVTAVLHSSGVYIATGAAGYIPGTLGTFGTAVLAFFSAPVTLWVVGTAAAIGIAGGAYCLVIDNDARQ